jgi:hypothetical protein
MTKEALKLALEALEADPAEMVEDENGHMVFRRIQAIITLREALANEALDKMAENARELGLDYEPEQPKVRTGNCLRVGVCASEGHKIQPQRTWVDATTWRGLTDEEIEYAFKTNSVMVDNGNAYMVAGLRAVNIAQAIEAKLKEKNT